MVILGELRTLKLETDVHFESVLVLTHHPRQMCLRFAFSVFFPVLDRNMIYFKLQTIQDCLLHNTQTYLSVRSKQTMQYIQPNGE